MAKLTSSILLFLLVFSSFAQDESEIEQNKAQLESAFQTIVKIDSLNQVDSVKLKVFADRMAGETNDSVKQVLTNQLGIVRDQIKENRKRLQARLDSLTQMTWGYPIVPDKDTVFFIHTPIGSFEADERAQVANDRMTEFYNSFRLSKDSIDVADLGSTVELNWSGNTILTITEADAKWHGKTKIELANEVIPVIYADVTRYQENKSWITWAKNIGFTLAVILAQIMLIKLVNYLFKKRIDPLLQSKKGTWFKGFKFRTYEILDANRELKFVLIISRFVRLGINAFQLYVTIPLIFIFFPGTQWIAETLFGYVLNPVKSAVTGFLDYIPSLITIIVIVTITRYIMKAMSFLSEEIQAERLRLPGFYADWAKPTFNIVRVLVYAFMFILIFPYLPGSDSPIFQGVSVFLGVMFSLGSTSVVGNMVAGLVMTYMRPFQIGDRVKINQIVGDVVERTAFVTRLKTPKQQFITIPNSNVLTGSVVNFSTSRKHGGIVVSTQVTIGYEVPWRKVHKALIEAGQRTDEVLEDPGPRVFQTSLNDFYVTYQLVVNTAYPRRHPFVLSGLHENIQDVFAEQNIEILSPHYEAGRNGNDSTVPEKYDETADVDLVVEPKKKTNEDKSEQGQ